MLGLSFLLIVFLCKSYNGDYFGYLYIFAVKLLKEENKSVKISGFILLKYFSDIKI